MISRIALKNLWHRPLNTVLSLILLTAAVAIISMLILLQEQFEKKFSDNIEGVDLVMGAKGSPLQLILSAVYQMDAPTGNINLDSAEVWMKNPFVKSAIPLAFGDNYRGYKIVGSIPEYIHKYEGKLAVGRMFKNDLEVVVGAEIARQLSLKLGDTFLGSHGDVEGGEIHESHPYKICGILYPTGKIIDNLIVSNLSSVWAVHNHHAAEDDTLSVHHEDLAHQHIHSESCTHDHNQITPIAAKEITAVLLKMRNKMALLTWPRIIAQNTAMQVASPAVEVNRLFTLFGVGIQALQYLAYGIMLISGISIFIALFSTLKERKFEFALMRISGATRGQLLLLVLVESLFLCLLGFIMGILAGRFALHMVSMATASEYKLAFDPFVVVWDKELPLLFLTLITGLIAASVPAFKAYQINISKTLADA